MIHKEENGIKWLEFEQLQGFSSLRHGVFLRQGGVSKGCYASLNAGGSTGDDPTCVEENRRRILSFFPSGRLISCNQVHGVFLQKTDISYDSLIGCDGLLTKTPNQALMIKHADCQATIFYDPIEKNLANIHCGWRGNVQNIYAQIIESLKKIGSNPSNLLVCISPSLGPNQSEFINFRKEFPSHFQDFQWKENYFNLWEISKMQLISAGILSSHIECAEICTYENSEDCFSYRREKVTGRHASVAMLC